jgi:hypothetical protein
MAISCAFLIREVASGEGSEDKISSPGQNRLRPNCITYPKVFLEIRI